MRGEALAAVFNNHPELIELWDWSLTVSNDTEIKARIRGVQSIMTMFNFYFGRTLGEQLLRRQTDNPGHALQDSSTSAAQGNRLAQDVVKTLLKDPGLRAHLAFFGLESYSAKLQRFRPLRILSYPGREKHQSGTKLENRTPTSFPKLPKTITDESTLKRWIP